MNQTLPLEDTPPAQAASSPPPKADYEIYTTKQKWARLDSWTKIAYIITATAFISFPLTATIGTFNIAILSLETITALFVVAFCSALVARRWWLLPAIPLLYFLGFTLALAIDEILGYLVHVCFGIPIIR